MIEVAVEYFPNLTWFHGNQSDDGSVHGYLCTWFYHHDVLRFGSEMNIYKKDWYKYGIKKEKFYMTEVGFFGKLFRLKPTKRLKRGWYLVNKMYVSYLKDDVPERIKKFINKER